MSTADLGYPILLSIMIFWAFLALFGILMSLVKQGKISGRKLRDMFHHHSHDQFLEQ